MISSSKILAFPERYSSRSPESGHPVTADIFLTEFCNNACPYCTYSRYKVRTKKYMPFSMFEKVALRLKELGVEGFVLTGGGEPTINPDFDKITMFLEKEKISYGINTNFNVYREFAPTYLKVSLDAHDENSYYEQRGVKCYRKVIQNVKNFLDFKKQNKLLTSVGLQCLAQDVQGSEMFYNGIKSLNVDYIVFRPLESTQGKYYKNIDNLNASMQIIEYLNEICKNDDRVKINYKWNELQTTFDRCYAQFAQIAVNCDGNVIYCCHKPYEIVGSVFDEDILEKKAKYKTNMMICDVPCRLTGANQIMKIYNELQKSPDKVFI